ncbi:9527_t:CDS:2 [Racocetra fulgida]|uniref:9527_t:CDS:1 n=1 Tax=Racocetra fulgida TaxID=60492 RepID=A0A9N8VXW6_9GLOM|nr:9527_t:CDS:2 [Racocetra fulgida]
MPIVLQVAAVWIEGNNPINNTKRDIIVQLKIILNELNIPITNEDLAKIELLNKKQKLVFNTIINYIEKNQPAVIFVNGPAGSCAQIINATLKFSPLWSTIKIFHLYQNMRIENNSEANALTNLLQRIGNRTEPTINNSMIRILDHIIIDWYNENSLETLIKEIYPHITFNSSEISYITNRAILITKNEYIDYINNIILEKLPDNNITYKSFDSVPNDKNNLYQQEFLNSITMADISQHKLYLKINTHYMTL